MTTAQNLLEGIDGWSMQMGVWRYAVQGDIAETSALIAEGHGELLRGGEAWDRTERDLRGQMVAYGGGPYERVKDAAALPWVTQHILRGHAPWTGLAAHEPAAEHETPPQVVTASRTDGQPHPDVLSPTAHAPSVQS